ncbi:unnamed protein product [Durusdinium trenchii]|uniref:Tyrosine-protein kinase ephrin type A/B receptor-like domain-containing protein n=2 Tax=Durusdinium trenchii TaxID=1381693 RepID=A0ABP0I7W2_9DINO
MTMRSCVISLVVPLVCGTCLDSGIPPSERKNLENANGDSYPLGIFVPDWAASWAANVLVATIVEEIFGYNVSLVKGTGTVSGFYAVSGCVDPTAVGDPGCGSGNVTKHHIVMEAWTAGYPLVWETLQNEYAGVAAKNLGNMGYEGLTSTFIPKPVQQEAYRTQGMALQYFKYWNASWYQPSKYFESISVIPSGLTKLCSDSTSVMTDDATMRRHIVFTGDVDGLVYDSTSDSYSARCDDGHWWLSPSCRSNSTLCVPFITGGVGWGIEELMQKSTKWNMPMALGVAASWSAYTEFPFLHPKSHFYWWIPDPTFLELEPLQVIYPPTDRRAYSSGDMSTAASGISVDKHVSRDLSVLAPNVENFVSNILVTMAQMNAILLDQKNTSDSWRETTCRWLRSNQKVWQSWIPDESQCFPGFGLYDTGLDDFTDHRVNASNKIVCQACPSGTFSQPLEDSIGETYICVPCAKGRSQPLGAATSCSLCKSGEYQDEIGSKTCKRCEIGLYQDELGAEMCKSCPASTTTLGLGSVSQRDCGCKKDTINIDVSGSYNCVPCSEGLTCPLASTLADLQSGESYLGQQYTPKVQEGYFTTVLAPTEVYRCGTVAACPGGKPGSCSGGLTNTPCAQCRPGATWTGNQCEACEGWRQVLWAMAVVGIFVFLVLLYYLTSSKVTAKATVLFATTASFGMLVMSMQNLGLIGMMTIDWPVDLKGIFSVCQFLLLDIDSYGFSCIAGSVAPIRYLLSALIFPVGVAWLGLCYLLSKLLPANRRWNGSKTVSTCGAFLQVGFSTMSATSLAPMMCYKHPNGLRSVLKYPDIICGSDEHTAMLVIGWILLIVFVLGFVTLCTFAVYQVPTWSANRRDHLVAGIRFLVFRFRLDSWWFGVPLLVRGPLLSLPVVLATDYPPIQVIAIAMVMAGLLVLQMLFWPWKVPMLNLTDCTVSFCITLLVTTSSLHLEIVEGPMMQFAEGVSTAMLSGIGIALAIMVLMTGSALIYRSALGGKKELRMFNLGSVPTSAKLAKRMKEMSLELERMETQDVSHSLAALAIFDMNKVTTAITLLATEVAPPAEDAVTYKFNPRINSSSFDPALTKSKKSLRSSRSSDVQANPVEELDNQPKTDVPLEVQEDNTNRSSRGQEVLQSSWL